MRENGEKNISASIDGKKPKSLLDRLVSTEREEGGDGKAGYLKGFFLIKRIEIEEALREGFGKKRIWAILNRDGEFPGSYSSFLKLVQAHIGNAKNSPSEVTESKEADRMKTVLQANQKKKLDRVEGREEKTFNPRPLKKEEIW